MKNLSAILIIIFFAMIEIGAQTEQPVELAGTNGTPKFFQDILEFSPGEKNLTRLDVYTMVPYTSLQFVKSGQGFTNRYSATVSIFDKDKVKLIEEKTWNERLEVNDFDQTTLKDNNSLSLKSFFLQPGEYFIRSAIHDRESNTDLLLERVYKVRDLSSELAVSDIMLLAKRVEEKGTNKIAPNVSGDIIIQKEGLPLFYEIYSKIRCKINIEYMLTDVKKAKVFEDSMSRDIDSGRTQIFHTIKDSSISLGLYSLEVVIKSPDNNLTASAQKSFISRLAGVPAIITDLDKAVNEMIYIAPPHDIDIIKKASTREEKLKRFLAFWKKVSATPEGDDNAIFDEYYRRVNYANEHFSRYFEGWRSDRGMVFILLGSPDNVERHPFDSDAKPYEIWEYNNLNLSFIFVDQTGFGDYRLITPLTGDLYRFRM